MAGAKAQSGEASSLQAGGGLCMAASCSSGPRSPINTLMRDVGLCLGFKLRMLLMRCHVDVSLNYCI